MAFLGESFLVVIVCFFICLFGRFSVCWLLALTLSLTPLGRWFLHVKGVILRQESVSVSLGKLWACVYFLSFVIGSVAYEGVESPEARTPSDRLSGSRDSSPSENSNEQ